MEFINRANPHDFVSNQVNMQANEEIKNHRKALSSIIDTIVFLGCQNISLRGHRDHGKIDPSGSYPLVNDGNFRMLLRYRMKSGDHVLIQHLKGASENCNYTSKRVQNEILLDIGTLIKNKISEKVKKSPCWVIMADETTDLSNREQMAIVIRYLSFNGINHFIHEEPIRLVDLFNEFNSFDEGESRMSGENISKVLLRLLKELDLDMGKLVGQSYDGAAAMSSQRVGVCAKIKEVSPKAEYFHCATHALNLITSQVNKIDVIRNA